MKFKNFQLQSETYLYQKTPAAARPKMPINVLVPIITVKKRKSQEMILKISISKQKLRINL